MKKVLNSVIATIFIFLLSAIPIDGFAEGWIEKTVVDKKIEINKNAKLYVDHEFGEVVCTNWDEDAIQVTAIVRVKTDDNNLAEKLFKTANVDVKGNSSRVEAICELNQKHSGHNHVKVAIDFEIKMPKTISLELENSYGVVRIEEVTGPAQVSVEYGVLEAEALLNSETSVEVAFGKGDIETLKDADVEAKYSQFFLGKGEKINFECEFSNADIGIIKDLSMEVEGGDARISELENLSVEAELANVQIGKLTGRFSGEVEYGNLDISMIESGFSKIEIENSYGTVNLKFSEEASYKLQGDCSYCNINYPKKNSNISSKKTGFDSKTISGTVGNKNNPGASVIIESEYGTVNLSNK